MDFKVILGSPPIFYYLQQGYPTPLLGRISSPALLQAPSHISILISLQYLKTRMRDPNSIPDRGDPDWDPTNLDKQ